MTDVLAKILNFRDLRGLTNEQLAEILRVDRTLPGKWEAGKAYPSRNKFPQFAKAMGISLDELVGDDHRQKLTSVTKPDPTGNELDYLKRELGRMERELETARNWAASNEKVIELLERELASIKKEKS